MEKLLVTTDFSGHSRKAIRFAFQYALQMKAEITLIHVLDLFDPDIAIDRQTSTPQLRWDEAIQLKANQLKKYIHVVFPKGVPDVAYEIVCHKLDRTLAHTIIQYAKKQHFSSVFCGENGASLYKSLLGSLPKALMNSCPIPLVIVPKNYKMLPLSSLCYVTDMQHLDDEINPIIVQQKALNISLKVLYFDYEINFKEQQKSLHQAAKTYENESVHFHYIKLVPQTEFKLLLEQSLQLLKPSLVILFRKQNRSLINRLLFAEKSVTWILESNRPLMVLPKK